MGAVAGPPSGVAGSGRSPPGARGTHRLPHPGRRGAHRGRPPATLFTHPKATLQSRRHSQATDSPTRPHREGEPHLYSALLTPVNTLHELSFAMVM